MSKPNDVTPHLQNNETKNLLLLEKKFLASSAEIENWFAKEWQVTKPPVYGSVDLRNAGFKLAPIDMNLFPAGFNNLNMEFLPSIAKACHQAIVSFNKDIKNILIIPENHTRNLFYWENIGALMTILTNAGFHIRVGSLLPDYQDGATIGETPKIFLQSIIREKNKIIVDDFVADAILLNNDLSDGIPVILENIEQIIMPPAHLGWQKRLKSAHFKHYENVSKEFSSLLDMDPWLISPLFRHCGEVDFMTGEGQACLQKNVQELLVTIEKKYQQQNITAKPFVMVKADSGTYGMAVMTVRTIEDIKDLNRKERTKMAKGKGGQKVSRVIIQEGVYTNETIGEEHAIAEPVVYLWGEKVVGGFYRVHNERGIDENLNAPGMYFKPLPFKSLCQLNSLACDEQNRLYVYGVIARLSMLAAAREMKEDE